MTKNEVLTVVDRHIVSQNQINGNQELIITSIMTLTWYRHYITGINRISLKKI
jgi:hypothetical protein